MIYVGIDIAKLNHFASALSSDGEILIEPFKFTNDGDGFQLLISKLDSFGLDNLIIGLESTAHYGDNLVRFFSPLVTRCVFLIPLPRLPCEKTTFAKPRRTKSTPTLLKNFNVAKLFQIHHLL